MYKFGNERTIPSFSCYFIEETIEFYTSLGFEKTYDMRRPYLYLCFKWNDVEIHLGDGPRGIDPAEEMTGGCIVEVEDAQPYHEAFTAGLRKSYGKVPAKGRPRITRFRPGQSRFTIVDPSGNTLIFLQSDEPDDLEYGGSKSLKGLAKAVDNARILREFKNDDRAAARVLDVALKKFGDASIIDRVRGLAARAELCIMLDDAQRAAEIHAELENIELEDSVRADLQDDLDAAEALKAWLEPR